MSLARCDCVLSRGWYAVLVYGGRCDSRLVHVRGLCAARRTKARARRKPSTNPASLVTSRHHDTSLPCATGLR